jgi:glycosyltransferase involved in cell wall biosynthesis
MIDGKLSLVLPAHNEEENVDAVVSEALTVLPKFCKSFEIIVVDDGSTDGTADIVSRLSTHHQSVMLVSHPVNRGYGAALRSGFEASTGEWVLIMDSDRQFDIGDLVYLAPLSSGYDLVAGYRMQRNDPPHRTLFGKTFRAAMRLLFGVQLNDIDCAFKLIRGDILRSLDLRSDGAMISTELMALWARTGANWTQVGVHHYPRTAGQQSGGSLRVILRAIRDVPVLWLRVHRSPASEPAEKANAVPNGISPASAGLFLGITAILTLFAIRAFRRK